MSVRENTTLNAHECVRKGFLNASTTNTSILDGSSVCTDWLPDFLPPLWQTDFVLAVVYCGLLGVALFLGAFGNLIILFITLTTRVMNKIGKDFLINLAVADFCVAVVGDPMCIIGAIKGHAWFNGQWILCEIVAGMCLTACLCSFLSLSMMAVNRYVFVCHNKHYYRIYRRPVSFIMCLLCWVFAFLFQFPSLLGWGDHTFDLKSHQCIWDRTADLSYTLFITGGLIGLPLIFMGICFVLIFRRIWKSKFDVFSLNLDDPLRFRRTWLEAVRSSKTLFTVFLVFIVCWTPYAVITAVDMNNTFSMEKHLFVTLLAHYHSALNIVVYTATNTAFRNSVTSMFTCAGNLKRRTSLDSSEPTDKADKTRSSSEDTCKVFFTHPRNSDCLPRKQMKYIGLSENPTCQENSDEDCSGLGMSDEDLTGQGITRVSSADNCARKRKMSTTPGVSSSRKEMTHIGSDADMKKYDSLEEVSSNDSDSEKTQEPNGHIRY